MMRDLMRSYKLKLKRKPSVSDSDAESQPLASSCSSYNSIGNGTERCMFPTDSDVTDCEYEMPTQTSLLAATPPSAAKMLRRPFCFPSSIDSPLDVYSNNEILYDRFQYFSKGGPIIPEDSLINNPKVLSPFFEEIEAAPPPTQSSLVTIFAIWNTIMGSSILAMAWGLEKAGLVPGIALIIFIAGICLYTAYVILQVNENHGLYKHNEVPELCRVLLGQWAEVIAKIFSLIVLIGANIVYWILMSNFFYHSVHFFFGYVFDFDETTNENATVICPKEYANVTTGPVAKDPSHLLFDQVWNLYSTVPIFLALIMFPILNFRSATFFTKFNSLGTISVLYLLGFVSVKAYSWGINVADWDTEMNVKSTFCALSGMLSLSYFIHNIIISIVKNNRHQENNGRDLSIAFGLVTFTYLFIGVLFYVCFPMAKACIEDNILNNFPKHDTLSIIARLLLFFQLFTVFPLIAYMLRMDVMVNINSIFTRHKYGDFTYCRVILLNLVVVIVCILFACFLPKIGTLIRYTGAISGMVYIFTLPNLLKIASLRKQNALTPLKFIAHLLIIAVGVLNMVSQFFIHDT